MKRTRDKSKLENTYKHSSGDYYRAFIKLEIASRTYGPKLAKPYPRKGSTLKLLQQGSRSFAQRTGACQEERSPRKKV